VAVFWAETVIAIPDPKASGPVCAEFRILPVAGSKPPLYGPAAKALLEGKFPDPSIPKLN
jgi:hypothetical protein